MDLPAHKQFDAAAQPTAARLLALMNSTRRRLTTAELAELAGVHPNSARLHLAQLCGAGMVERSTAPSGRGRPHFEWSISPDASIDGERPIAYRELATWLSQSISSLTGALQEIETTGQRIGRELAPAGGGGDRPAEALQSALSAMGFQPSLQKDGTRSTFTLANCPYRDVAKANPGVVCTLHRGIAHGLVKRVDPASELTGFVIREPDRAGCLIEIDTPVPSTPGKEH